MVMLLYSASDTVDLPHIPTPVCTANSDGQEPRSATLSRLAVNIIIVHEIPINYVFVEPLWSSQREFGVECTEQAVDDCSQ